MCKDLRKWCGENENLFLQGNGIEDETSIGCRESVNTMHYNSHFKFEMQIWEYPNDSTVILDLFDASAGNEISKKYKLWLNTPIYYFFSLTHLIYIS